MKLFCNFNTSKINSFDTSFYIPNNHCQKQHIFLKTNSPRNAEDLGLIPGTGRYMVARMNTKNGGHLSNGPIPSDRLKNRHVDK